MLDIRDIRQYAEQLQKICEYKNKDIDIGQIIFLDDQRKQLQQEIDELKHTQKKTGEMGDFTKAKELKTKIQTLQKEFTDIKKKLDILLRDVPNFVHESVPFDKTEEGNKVIKRVGEQTSFDFSPKDHQTLLESVGGLDKQHAAEVTGSRFFYLKGAVAQLQYALINYVFKILQDELTLQHIIDENNLDVPATPFQLIIPPTIVNYETMDKMGRLHPKDDRYCLEKDNQVLIGSAEHSLGPLVMNQTLKIEDLPWRCMAYTSAYRREAGSYGKDTQGIFRTHEFHKIEMQSFSTKEQGLAEQDFFLAIQEYIMQKLGIPYQVVNKCTGDVGAMDYRAFDIEAWFPSQQTYRETHTSDYMTDYQARRLQARYMDSQQQKHFLYMNDATAVALGRTIATIVENYQQADGRIRIPEILQSFMGGKVYIS